MWTRLVMGSSEDSGRTLYLNEKTASSPPSVLGIGPRGEMVNPAMVWLSSSIKSTWLDRTILPLYGRAVCSAMLYYRSKVFVLDGGFRSRRWQIYEEYHLMKFNVRTRVGGIAQGDRKLLFARWRSYSTEYRLR